RPIVAYNIPSRVVVDIEPETITRLAEIPNVRAVKQAHPDPGEARHIVSTGLDLYAGDGELLQPFLELGGVGGVLVHSHIVGPQVAEQVRAFKAGDTGRSREIDGELRPAFDLLGITTNPIPIKAALALLGHDVGGYRLPLVPPTPDELERVRDCLARLGLLASVYDLGRTHAERDLAEHGRRLGVEPLRARPGSSRPWPSRGCDASRRE